MELIGFVHKVIDLSGNTFPKKTLVLKTDDQYPQLISIDFLKEKMSLLNDLAVGDKKTVSININGREHSGNFYNSIIGWRIK